MGDEAGVHSFGAGPANARSWTSVVWRGMRRRCPECGVGGIFAGYTRTADSCAFCGLDISGHRADDAPPYLTILAIGHLIIPASLVLKQVLDPPLAMQFAIWLPLMAILAASLLPVSKGAMIGLQWANRMHGFGEQDADPVEDGL